MLSGWLLSPCLPLIEQSPDSLLLAALRQHLSQLGYRTCASVIQLHAQAQIPLADRDALLNQLLPASVPDHDSIKQALTELLAAVLPPADHFSLGRSWSEILYCPLPERWDVVQAKAVGRWAVLDRSVLTGILQEYGFGEADRIHRGLIAVGECLAQGGGTPFTVTLTQMNFSTLPIAAQQRYSALLTRRNAAFLSATDQEAIARWLQPQSAEQMQIVYLAIDVLADTSPIARQTMQQWIPTLPKPIQAEMEIRFLRFLPIDQHPPITQLEKPAQRMLIQVYRQQAAIDRAAFDHLLMIAQLPLKDIAIAASTDLKQVYPDLVPAQLLPLLRSHFPGVRANALMALIDLATQPVFTALDLSAVCQELLQEKGQNVARLLCNLVTAWVRQNQQLPPQVFESLRPIPDRLIAQKLFEGGTARALMDALKAIAQSEAPTIDPIDLAESVQQILTTINLMQVRNSESEMIDLLCALNRLHPALLDQLVMQTCPRIMQQGWLRNVSAVIKTIRRIEGPSSPLFEQIRARDWCTSAIEALILEAMGL